MFKIAPERKEIFNEENDRLRATLDFKGRVIMIVFWECIKKRRRVEKEIFIKKIKTEKVVVWMDFQRSCYIVLWEYLTKRKSGKEDIYSEVKRKRYYGWVSEAMVYNFGGIFNKA